MWIVGLSFGCGLLAFVAFMETWRSGNGLACALNGGFMVLNFVLAAHNFGNYL